MKFSIGIPAYKATYLRECIDSILAQTFTDFELVIVNDASPEDINSIIHSYNHSSIKYFVNEKNFGAENVVDNWNKCLSYAQGEYFVLMGDDDKMCPDYLAEFSLLIDKYPKCNVYHCRAFIINEASDPFDLTEPRPEFESVYDNMLQRIQSKRRCFISDHVFKTEKLKSHGGFFKLPLAWASDDISTYLAAKEHGIAHTNNPVFMYRFNSQNISSTGNIYKKMEAILYEEKWLNCFLDKSPDDLIDILLWQNIKNELKRFIQKKKLSTIYTSPNSGIASFFKWFSVRKKYGISIAELFYAILMRIKENKKKEY